MLRLAFVLILIVVGAAYSLRSSFYALLFYLWIAYFRPEIWIWGDALQGARLSLAAGVYLVLAVVLRGERLWPGKTGVLIAVLCLHSLVSTLLSDAFAYSWPFWIDFAKSSAISCVIILLVTSYERLRLTLIVIAVSLGFEGVKQGWVYLLTNPGDVNQNTVALLGDNNGVAVGMLMLSAVILALAQTSKARWARFGFRFALVGTIFRALSTFSRGGLLSFGAMCSVYWLRSTRKLASLVVLVVLAGGLLSALPESYWERMGTMTTDRDEMDASAGSRVYFWGIGFQMAQRYPIFGVGHNAYSRYFDQYDETGGLYGRSRAVHSTWFGTLADLGFPGLMLLVTILVVAFRRCAQARREALKNGDVDLAQIASSLQTALVTFCVGGTFLSFQYTEVLWHFIALSSATYNIAFSTATAAAAVPAAQPQISRHPVFARLT